MRPFGGKENLPRVFPREGECEECMQIVPGPLLFFIERVTGGPALFLADQRRPSSFSRR